MTSSSRRRRPWQDPYTKVLQSFNRRGVRYVVVGMAGINYYGESAASTFSTFDYDLFVEPTRDNLQKAFDALTRLDFTLGTSEGELKLSDLAHLVRGQKTLVATTADGLMVELLLKISGFPFSEMARDAATFTVEGVPVRVGRLNKLLMSKKLAGRPKDRRFLSRYQNLLEEEP